MSRRIITILKLRLAVLAPLALIALLALQLGCDPLEPDETDQPLLGKIVFSAKRDSSNYHQIYTVNADGTDLQQVTFFAEDNAYSPSWFPDGVKIVFISDSIFAYDSGDYMFTIAADGSGIQRIFGYGLKPVVSPAGNLLAYYGCPGSRCGDILVRELEQGNLQGTRIGRDPAWSSGGIILASVSDDTVSGFEQIFTADAYFFDPNSPGDRLTATPTDKQTPVWSPDDSRIAFISGRQIIILSLENGTEAELITVDAPNAQVPSELHAWVGDESEHLLVTLKDTLETYSSSRYLSAVNVQSGAITLIVIDSTVKGADWHLPQ